jgi:hypothetical protein
MPILYISVAHNLLMRDMSTNPSVKSSSQIAIRITEAILAKQLAPGPAGRAATGRPVRRFAHPGAGSADAAHGTRHRHRQCAARLVRHRAHAGQAREAFEARRVIELGLLRQARVRPVSTQAIRQLREHIAREEAAIAGADVGRAATCWATSTSACANAWATRCCRKRCAT